MKHKQALIFGSIILIIIVVTLWGRDVREWQRNDISKDPPVVDPELLSAAKVSESLDYLIYFEEQADLSAAYELPWEQRGWYVYETLMAQAEKSQEKVRKFLDRRDVSYQSFWIQNVIAVEDSSALTLNGLMKFYEIESLNTVPVINLENPLGGLSIEETEEAGSVTANLLHINADDAWSAGYTGEGFVVGSIDTGVRYTHDALKPHYRGYSEVGFFSHSYQWWDAVNSSDSPYDDHGHGSHTTGIMVGADSSGNVTGVAPGAEWIACKAISKNGSGLGWDFLECGEFMLAPWDLEGNGANPDLRPHVVNNSWGGCSQTSSDWFKGTIDAWHAAGIYPVFANGNASNCGYTSPPGLNTVGNPARSYHVTAVGSTGMDDGQYASHSNWGPTDDEDILNGNGYPWIKPQVVAPGVGIRSAVSSADDAFASWGGTSMSAPHVSGLVTLMWQAAVCLVGDYVQTENLIEKSAVPIPYETGNGDEGPGNVPNHATGWGEIDVLAAVEEAQTFCNVGDDMLTLSGTIKDGSGHGYPLFAKISLVSDHHNPITFTDPFSGVYEMKVYKNTVYNLEITSEIDGYQSISETQLIFDEQNAARDYSLKVTQDCDAPGYSPSGQNNTLGAEGCSVQPGGILAGFIQDVETGLPLNGAAISHEGYFVKTRGTTGDPDLPDGFYWAFLPMAAEKDVLSIQVSNDFYKTFETEITISRDNIMEKDFTLRHYKEILKEFFSMVWEKIVAFASKTWDHVKVFFQGVWEKVAGFFQVVWENIASFFTNLWGQIGNWFLRVFSPKQAEVPE
jgi:subtilisin family serine protease